MSGNIKFKDTIKERFRKGLVNNVNWGNPELTSTGYSLRKERLQMLKWVGNIKGKKALDIGISSGRFVISFANKGAKTYGLEICKEVIDETKLMMKERGLTGTFKLGDAENMPFKDNTFDIVNCQQVLLHIPNKEKAIKEMKRVLKPGGMLIVDMTNRYGPFHLYKRGYWRLKSWKTKLTGKKGADANSVETLPNKVFLNLLRRNGLKISDIKAYGYIMEPHFLPKSLCNLLNNIVEAILGNKVKTMSSFLLVKATK